MTIEQRFERLEQANRRWRLATMVLVLVVVAGLLMAQGGASTGPDVIQTRRLDVLNKKGLPVITLDSGERGGRISTTDSLGRLFFEAEAGELSIYNEAGQKLARVGTTKEGQGMMVTYNHNGEGVVAIGATKDGKGALTTYNGNGQKQVTLSATEAGGAISVWNNHAQAASTIRADEDGNGEVGAWDRDGKGRKLTPAE